MVNMKRIFCRWSYKAKYMDRKDLHYISNRSLKISIIANTVICPSGVAYSAIVILHLPLFQRQYVKQEWCCSVGRSRLVLLWIISELSEMQLDILAMMIQLKVGGKTHKIVEEQAIGNCKTGLTAVPCRGFSKPDTNWMCCVKAAFMVLHDTVSAFTPVSKNLLLVKTELGVGRLYFELWYWATIVNCNLNHRTYHSSRLARTWLLVFHLASWLLHLGAKEREES